MSSLSKGVKLSLTNARTFLNEATLLIENHYLRHSIGLIELAAEEIGKATSIQDKMAEVTIMRKKMVNLDPAVFRNHKTKLKASPVGGMVEHTKEERRLHRVLVRFFSSGSVLRQRSFYVDLRRNWQWGNPKLERESILWYVINDLGMSIELVKEMAAIVQRTNRMIEMRGFDDRRVQKLIKDDPFMKDLYETKHNNPQSVSG